MDRPVLKWCAGAALVFMAAGCSEEGDGSSDPVVARFSVCENSGKGEQFYAKMEVKNTSAVARDVSVTYRIIGDPDSGSRVLQVRVDAGSTVVQEFMPIEGISGYECLIFKTVSHSVNQSP